MEWNRRAAGLFGEVRCGHQVAARLGVWDIAPSGIVGEHDPDGAWSFLSQTDTERNAFWLTHGNAFDLVLTDQFDRRLRFRGVEILNDEKIGARGRGAPEVIG